MNKTTLADAALLDIALDRWAAKPLFEQLVETLRQVILSGRLEPGAKLPSSRKFAGELSVSRVTIVTAYDQLMAEGYIESRHGAGSFVAKGLPEEALQIGRPTRPAPAKARQPDPVRPFQPTVPDMRLFPHKQWTKLYQKIWSYPNQALLGNIDPLGWWPLRVQIAEHLRVWRGINCRADQVVITSGASEALQTIIDGLLEPSQTIALEEPGYRLFNHILKRAHLTTQGVKVDGQGLCVDELASLNPQPVCAITTPSRQYPLGITMPLARRLQLLEWAGQEKRFVIEDDYDSEYRYVGQPLPALMSLASDGLVIYQGSFSKVFSKSLRLGFMVVPENFLPQISAAIKANGGNASLAAQPVLAKFMEDGSFASHIRRMRRIYATRQKAFLTAAQEHLSGLIEFEPAGSGMHLVGMIGSRLVGKMDDVEISRRAGDAGIVMLAMSKSYTGAHNRQGLIAGYAGFSEDELHDAVKRLAKVLEAT